MKMTKTTIICINSEESRSGRRTMDLSFFDVMLMLMMMEMATYYYTKVSSFILLLLLLESVPVVAVGE